MKSRTYFDLLPKDVSLIIFRKVFDEKQKQVLKEIRSCTKNIRGHFEESRYFLGKIHDCCNDVKPISFIVISFGLCGIYNLKDKNIGWCIDPYKNSVK